MIAKRLAQLDSQAIRQAFATATARPGMIDLSIGYPTEPTPAAIKQAGIAAIEHNHTRYIAPNGLPELRAAISHKLARDNHIDLSPDAITVTPGVTTAILLAYFATLDPGDQIIIPDPYFPPYVSAAHLVEAEPILVDAYPSFQLTADQIAERLTPKTKAILLNSPNNPTGAIYPESELRAIAALAAKHNLLIISDEIYERFAFDRPHFSIGSIYPNTLTLNGFSKSHAMTGWRIGYIAGPQPIIEAVNELQQYVTFSSSSIGQYAALQAIQQPTDELVAIYQHKHAQAKQSLGELTPLAAAEGAFYCYFPTPAGISDNEFVAKCLEHNVQLLPSRAFSARTDYARLAYVAKPEQLKQGLEIIAALFSAA